MCNHTHTYLYLYYKLNTKLFLQLRLNVNDIYSFSWVLTQNSCITCNVVHESYCLLVCSFVIYFCIYLFILVLNWQVIWRFCVKISFCITKHTVDANIFVWNNMRVSIAITFQFNNQSMFIYRSFKHSEVDQSAVQWIKEYKK